MPIGFLRTYLLVLGLLALVTAAFLDGIMLRYVLQPLVRRFEAQSARPVALPPGMRFMLEHAWARRAYNASFGLLLLGIWWFLGTPSAASLIHR